MHVGVIFVSVFVCVQPARMHEPRPLHPTDLAKHWWMRHHLPSTSNTLPPTSAKCPKPSGFLLLVAMPGALLLESPSLLGLGHNMLRRSPCDDQVDSWIHAILKRAGLRRDIFKLRMTRLEGGPGVES